MELLLQQLTSLIEDTKNEISILSNVTAFIYTNMEDVSWVGFYLYQNEELILGPFQGKIACTNIPLGKGVCGNCAKDQTTYIVPNVHKFKGHIACDSASNSEIVIPIMINRTLYGVLDIDSTSFDRFHENDRLFLEGAMTILANKLSDIKKDS